MTRSAVGSGAGARPEQSQAERRAGGAGRLRGRSGPRAPSALRPCRAVLRGPHAFRGFPPSSGLSEPFSGRATRRWDGISPGRCVVDSLAFPRRTFLRGGREVRGLPSGFPGLRGTVTARAAPQDEVGGAPPRRRGGETLASARRASPHPVLKRETRAHRATFRALGYLPGSPEGCNNRRTTSYFDR